MKFFCYLFITALARGRSHGQDENSRKESALKCPPGMEKSICAGCWSKCPVEEAVCEKKDCERGCACEEDGFLWHNGKCIPAYQCPFIPKEGESCPKGMVWSSCSGCHDYCQFTGQKCVQGCRIGCICKKKDQRMYYRECRNKYACQQEFAVVKSCPKGMKWANCADCERFCFPESDCAHKCNRGCVCENRKLAIYKGQCMMRKDCTRFADHETSSSEKTWQSD